MKTPLIAATALLAAAASTSASATVTGSTGGGQPFDNLQPSLAVTEVLPITGVFPSIGSNGTAFGDTLGFVYDFAGNFARAAAWLRRRSFSPSSRIRRCSACSALPMAAAINGNIGRNR